MNTKRTSSLSSYPIHAPDNPTAGDWIDKLSSQKVRATCQISPWLLWSTIFYLILPLAIFLWGWLKPGLAIILLIFLIVSSARLGIGLHPKKTTSSVFPGFWQFLVFLIVIEWWVGVLGAGGFGVQTWDWAKHNAIMRDLIDRTWPVSYKLPGEEAALVYYVAYYLPAALIGKLTSWTLANVALYAWTVLGCILAGSWLMVLTRAPWWGTLMMLVLFSGLDLVGDAFWGAATSIIDWADNFDAEWWAKVWSLPSNLSLIAFAPHQAIAGWLLTSLLVAGFLQDAGRCYFNQSVLLAVSLIWSPFVTFGLAAISGLWMLSNLPHHWGCESGGRYTSLSTVLPLALVMVMVAFFLAHFVDITLPADFYTPDEVIERGKFYLTPLYIGFLNFLPVYLLTTILEFGFFSFILIKIIPKEIQVERRLLIVATVILGLLPLFHYGTFNDLVMRASIPSLWVLQILILRNLSINTAHENSSDRRLKHLMLAILVLGCLYPLNILRLTVTSLHQRSWDLVMIPDHNSIPNLFELHAQYRGRIFFLGQYLGSCNSWFFQYLAMASCNKLEVNHSP